MHLLELLDRIGQRRLERYRISPPRPTDTRQFVGVLFFAGYYFIVYTLLKLEIPALNAGLVRDAMLVLGPVVGAIGQALFRTDVKDEIATQNTGEFARASRTQAEATIAAASTTPTMSGADAALAAATVADAAVGAAEEFRDEGEPVMPETKP